MKTSGAEAAFFGTLVGFFDGLSAETDVHGVGGIGLGVKWGVYFGRFRLNSVL